MTPTVTVPADAIPEPLQSIRNELTRLRAEIGPLEQAEALLAPIYAPGKPEKTRKPRRKKPAAARPRRNSTLSTLPPPPETYPVLDAIDALGKATTEQLMARTGLAKPMVIAEGQQLKRLGLVELAGGADGKPVWVRAADPDRAAA